MNNDEPMTTPKYIRTPNDQIIMFSEGIQHSTFRHLNPVSAGFVKITSNFDEKDGCKIKMECYGESEGLGLKSEPLYDTKLLEVQFSR